MKQKTEDKIRKAKESLKEFEDNMRIIKDLNPKRKRVKQKIQEKIWREQNFLNFTLDK